MYFWLHWVFVAMSLLFLVVVSGSYSVASHRLLVVVASIAEHRL